MFSVVSAQLPQVIVPEQVDPSDVYFQGFLATRASEDLAAKGDYIGAWEKLQQADQLFLSVKRSHPAWKPEMLNSRIQKNQQTMNVIGPKATEQKRQKSGVMAEIEGSNLTPDSEPKKALPEVQKPNIFQPQPQPSPSQSQSTSSAVMQQMQVLNDKIRSLEQERNAMALALRQSRGEQTKSMARAATLEADLNVAQQQLADAQENMKKERSLSNDVVEGQRQQLALLEGKLKERTAELTQAKQQNESLKYQLEQSLATANQLREEKEVLIKEKDQLTALLDLNENGKVQELIQQNMDLAKQLREASEKMQDVQKEQANSSNDYIQALRDLAIVKSQINRLHIEKQNQDQAMKDLESKLRQEKEQLSQTSTPQNSEENELLRNIIDRQLKIQERRKQAKQTIIDSVKQFAEKEPEVAEAMTLFESSELELSQEEQKLLTEKNVDGEFVSPYAQDPTTVNQATLGLNSNLEGYDRAAVKAFESKRYLSAKELYTMMIDANPGHVEAMLKLGVVHLHLNEVDAALQQFTAAVELNQQNPYAFMMLGYCYFQKSDWVNSELNLRKSIELSPDNYKAHLYLALLAKLQKRPLEEEAANKAAIAADPMQSDPYYNLAYFYAQNKKLTEAKEFYAQALERGAKPDVELEKIIRESDLKNQAPSS